MSKISRRRFFEGTGAGLVAALTPLLASGSRTYRVGAKNFSEQFILAELISERLADVGATSERKEGLGSAVAFRALAASDIDVYVDYSGTLWTNVLARTDTPESAVMLKELTAELAARFGVTLLGPLGFENAYALAMRHDRAAALGVHSIADLATHAGELNFGTDLEFLSEQDRAALAFIRQQRNRHASTLQLDVPGALAVLVGHPLLFWSQQPERPLQLVRGEPELVVRALGEDLAVHLVPAVQASGACMVLRDAPDRLRLVEIRSEHHRLARILGTDGLHLPASAQARLTELLSSLRTRVPVVSELVLEGERSRPAARQLYALLTPHAQGLALQYLRIAELVVDG